MFLYSHVNIVNIADNNENSNANTFISADTHGNTVTTYSSVDSRETS